jgi:hypothetical protein
MAAIAIVPVPSRAQGIPPLDIYLLMGQSNMSGRAPLTGLPAFENASHVWMFRKGRFIPAVEPVGQDPAARVGPSLAFANDLYAANHRPIGLINCALGGTFMSQWSDFDDPKGLYRTCVDQAKLAQINGSIRGILFFQGEYDAWKMETVLAWPAKMVALAAMLRQDFANASLPIVITEIGPESSRPETQTLISEQGAMTTSITHLAVVSATDLPYLRDNLHLTQASEITLGRRYAVAMLSLFEQDGAGSDGKAVDR